MHSSKRTAVHEFLRQHRHGLGGVAAASAQDLEAGDELA